MKLSRRFASRKDHHQKGGEFVSAGESAAARIKVAKLERAERPRHRAAPLRPSASAAHTAGERAANSEGCGRFRPGGKNFRQARISERRNARPPHLLIRR